MFGYARDHQVRVLPVCIYIFIYLCVCLCCVFFFFYVLQPFSEFSPLIFASFSVKPCIIFMDEIDAIGGRRFSEGTSADREIQRTLMELLNQLDGFDELGKVYVYSKLCVKGPQCACGHTHKHLHRLSYGTL